VSPGEASHASPSRAARSIAGGAVAPIQTSTGSAGFSATRAESKEKIPDEVTVSPAHRRRSADSDSSNAATRLLIEAPMARNCASSSPSPHWKMKRPRMIAASVPTCSAISTGFQSGSKNRQPAGWSLHSASSRASIGTFW
jgi:hypothetical protein